ncbi:MAG: hypothetical protein R6U62_06900 [Bacteroidales bacterium]
MTGVRVVNVVHPSGELYRTFCRFAGAHKEGSFFQSAAFIDLIDRWPEAEWVLLLAVREGAMKDPGAHYTPPGQSRTGVPSGKPLSIHTQDGKSNSDGQQDKKHRPATQISASAKNVSNQGVLSSAKAHQKRQELTSSEWTTVVDPSEIAGSLLAVIIQEKPHGLWCIQPFKQLYRNLSARTIVYGGPLLASGTRLRQEQTLVALLEALNKRVNHRSLFTQFRNFFDVDDMIPVFKDAGYQKRDRLNLLLNTTSQEEAWNNLTTNRRRQIRLSIRNGATIIANPSEQQVDSFYEILATLYQRQIKKPLPGRDFFHALANNNYLDTDCDVIPNEPNGPNAGTEGELTENGVAKQSSRDEGGGSMVLLVGYEGKVVGGVACVWLPAQTMHEWYACGLDREYKDKKVYPSVLATWAAIKTAANMNIPHFDFMGMGKPDIPYGVRDFKKEFGGKWVSHGRFSRINNRLLYFLAEIGYNLLFFFQKNPKKT